MEQNNSNIPQEQEIDLLELFGKLWRQKRWIIKAVGYGALFGLVIAFSLPKKYSVTMTLSPESGKAGGGGLAGMASMLGLGSAVMTNADALNVSLFPDIMASTPFALELYDMKVKPEESDTLVALHEYVTSQRSPWWSVVLGLPGKAVGGVMSLFKDKQDIESQTLNPFRLTLEEKNKVQAIKDAMTAEADAKTGITTITVTLQDPLVTATVADSVIHKLQDYITAYRTKKALEDFTYQEKICTKAKEEYYRLQKEYAAYVDKNQKVSLSSAKIEGERMKSRLDLANQIYQQAATQQEIFRAKIQEDKPVFAVVEPASVPLRASSPKKMLILVGCMFLAFIGSSAWILFGKELWADLKEGIAEKDKE